MKSTLSILLVSYEFPPHMNTGGIGTYMFHLANLLSSAGHRVTVFSAKLTGGPVQKEENKNYTNYLFQAATQDDFRTAVRIFFRKYVNQEPVDIIESPEVGACALGIKEDNPNIPLIVRLHTPGVIITRVSNTYQPLLTKLRFVMGAMRRGRMDLGYWSKTDKNRAADPEYKISQLADQLVSPSKALADYLTRYWQLKKEISIVPNPFHADADLFQFPIEGREKLICFVGKLTVLKGMFTLTKAVKVILRKHPDYRFVFAGRDEAVSETMPSMRAWMEEKLKDVIDRVEFTGVLKREHVKILFGRSRICVVPSLWENYPTVVLEAMAAGNAVAAANRGGIPDMFDNKKSGVLFNPKNHKSLARCLDWLMINDETRIMLASKAREKIRTESLVNNNKIKSLYEKRI